MVDTKEITKILIDEFNLYTGPEKRLIALTMQMGINNDMAIKKHFKIICAMAFTMFCMFITFTITFFRSF